MRPSGIPSMDLYQGPAGYRRFLQEWLGAFPDSILVTESVEATDTRVIAVVRQEMRGAGSDVPVTFHYAALIGFCDGARHRVRVPYRPPKRLRALRRAHRRRPPLSPRAAARAAHRRPGLIEVP